MYPRKALQCSSRDVIKVWICFSAPWRNRTSLILASNRARRCAVRPVGIYFWIMTSGQYIITYVLQSIIYSLISVLLNQFSNSFKSIFTLFSVPVFWETLCTVFHTGSFIFQFQQSFLFTHDTPAHVIFSFTFNRSWYLVILCTGLMR